MNLNDSIYFMDAGFHNKKTIEFWNSIREQSGEGGKFFIDVSKRMSPNISVSRCSGEWSLPWPQDIIPGFEAPEYDPTFNKSYSDITDLRALEIKHLIQQGNKFALFYSGGIDSTLVLYALLKNLSAEELKSIAICSSIDSILENPNTWHRYIQDKFQVFDSTNYWFDDIIQLGYFPITSEPADQIMGNLMAITMYHNYDAFISHLSPDVQTNLKKIKHKISSDEVHYSAYQDLIVRHLAYDKTPQGLKFGRILYEKYNNCVKTSPWPAHSLHDFFWSSYFNLKYTNCILRGPLFYNSKISKKECLDKIVPWFHTEDYQKWAMVNNNNGQKIRNTLATYKYASREYIHNFDKNDWYFHFKTKLESLTNVRAKFRGTNVNFGMDKNYQMLSIEDNSVKEYFKHHVTNYKIGWIDEKDLETLG